MCRPGSPGADSRVYAWRVETKQEIREFLTSRRARVTPQALTRALQLDDAERAHLLDLARAAQPDEALKLLGSRAATADPAESARATNLS
jgi:hypothetical protein